MVRWLLRGCKYSMKYRSRQEIQASILGAANGGATKSKLMYKAFLSYVQALAYMKELLVNGMLEYNISQESCRTTERGNNFLKVYKQLEVLVNN